MPPATRSTERRDERDANDSPIRSTTCRRSSSSSASSSRPRSAVTVFVFWVGIKIGLWPSVSGIIAALVAMLMVRFLARGMTSPLREMAEATAEMAKGNYDAPRRARPRATRSGELARAFNQMAAELAETDRVRRDLVANVSHELRTPITALQANLENLVDGVSEPDPETFAHHARAGRAARPAGHPAARPLPARVRRGAARAHRVPRRAAARPRGAGAAVARSRGRRLGVGRLSRPHGRRRSRARAPGGRQPARERGAPHSTRWRGARCARSALAVA